MWKIDDSPKTLQEQYKIKVLHFYPNYFELIFSQHNLPHHSSDRITRVAWRVLEAGEKYFYEAFQIDTAFKGLSDDLNIIGTKDPKVPIVQFVKLVKNKIDKGNEIKTYVFPLSKY